MVLVSVDDHVVEPPGLFDDRLPAKYADLAPKFVTNEDGTKSWLYEGQLLPNVALNAVAGRPREEYGIEPTSFDQLRPGCYDIDERVKDMDANGVLGSCASPPSPNSAASCSPAPRTRTWPWPWSGPTTTGTSTTGAGPTRAGSSRAHCPPSGTRR